MKSGTTVTLQATPNDGFKFGGWKDAYSGSILSSSISYTFTLEKHINIYASFAYDFPPRTLTVSPSGTVYLCPEDEITVTTTLTCQGVTDYLYEAIQFDVGVTYDDSWRVTFGPWERNGNTSSESDAFKAGDAGTQCVITYRAVYGDLITESVTLISHNHTGGTATCVSGPICEKCNEEYGESLGFTEHDWGEWTDAGDGNHTRTCKRTECGLTETHAIDWSAWATDPENDANHYHECQRDGCNARETEPHHKDEIINSNGS